jgi:hypothetical protein
MAEVAAMQGGVGGRRADTRAGEEAIMGAAAADDDRFEVVDESGACLCVIPFVSCVGGDLYGSSIAYISEKCS